MKKFVLALLLLILPAHAFGQGPPTWILNGSTINPFQNTMGVALPTSVIGGNKGAGTINAVGLYVNGVAVLTTASTIPLTIDSTTITSSTSTRILKVNSDNTLGEYTLTGTGTVVVMQTGASLITPVLGVATGTTLALGTNVTNRAGVLYLADDSIASLYMDGGGGTRGAIYLRNSGGTQASRTASPDNSTVGNIEAFPYTPTGGYWPGASIDFVIDGTVTNGQAPPTRINFYTNPNNDVTALAMTIRSDLTSQFFGNVGIHASPVSGSSLTVGLNINISNNQAVQWGGANDLIQGNGSTHALSAYTNGSLALTIDSAQKTTFSGALGFTMTNTLDIGTSATVLAPRTVYAGTSFVGPTGTFTTRVNTPQVGNSGAGGLYLSAQGSGNYFAVDNWVAGGSLTARATGIFGWMPGADPDATGPDIAFSRISAGIIGVGTGAAGSVAGSLSMAGITVSGASTIFSGLGSDATHTDNSVCVDSSNGTLYKGSGTLGVCLGTSSLRYKTGVVPLTVGLPEIMALRSVNFRYKKGYGDDGARTQYGFIAEEVANTLPGLVGMDSNGRPNTVDMLGIIPVMVGAIQQLQRDMESIRGKLKLN